jgi:hypothetical protein
VVNPVSVFYNGLFLHSFNEKNTGATTPERQHGDWGGGEGRGRERKRRKIGGKREERKNKNRENK